MEGSLFIATALLIGRLGEVPAAAHQIAINVASLCFMMPLGLAEATTVRVGHALGRGDRDGVRRAAFAGYALDVGHAGGVGRRAAVRQPRARGLLHAPTPRWRRWRPRCCCTRRRSSSPTACRCCRPARCAGCKDTRVPMLLAALAYWGVGMPLGAGLGPGPGLGPAGHVGRPDRRPDRRGRPAVGTRFVRSSRAASPGCAGREAPTPVAMTDWRMNRTTGHAALRLAV